MSRRILALCLGPRLLLSPLFGVPSAPAPPEEPPRLLQIDDLYRLDEVANAITLSDGRGAIYCRRRADPATGAIKQSLWRVDDQGPPRPLEVGEPDGFSPVLSPDGMWIAFLSTRALSDGARSYQPVPPYSEPAADLWLIPSTGGNATPLAGRSRPYGRVIADTFYGRVAFSPDGKRLAFVADMGTVARTDAERRNNVQVLRKDQGEGYEGFGPAQVWVADLLDHPAAAAAARVSRLTPDDYWYGDPQWSPDGSFIVVCANRTPDQEAVRFNISRNYDLWKIALADRRVEQLTTGPGPEFSPRISPDGRRILCLSSPRRGPHFDVYNLMVVDLVPGAATTRVVFDHHGAGAETPPHLPPTVPLNDHCWIDNRRVVFAAYHGSLTEWQSVDVDSGVQVAQGAPAGPAASPLLPTSDNGTGGRCRALDETVRWQSVDGLWIDGILTLPPPSAAKPPYKLLLMPHGGPHSRSVDGRSFDVQFFAARGFAVFQPNYRGSMGYGLKFLDADRNDLGGADMRDILTGIDHLAETGVIDRGRQFIFGASYGGFLAGFLISHSQQFRGAVMQGPPTDWGVMWHLSDVQSFAEWELGSVPWEAPDRMRERSSLSYVAGVHTPTLILVGANDRRCPPPMSRMYYAALRKLGVETEMVVYPDEGHQFKQLRHREDMLLRVLDWFERHDVPKT